MYNLAYAAAINRGKFSVHSAERIGGVGTERMSPRQDFTLLINNLMCRRIFILKMCLDAHIHNHLDIMPLESIPIYHICGFI